MTATPTPQPQDEKSIRRKYLDPWKCIAHSRLHCSGCLPPMHAEIDEYRRQRAATAPNKPISSHHEDGSDNQPTTGAKQVADGELRHDFHIRALSKSSNAKDCGDLTVLPLGFAVDLAVEAYLKGKADAK